MAADAIILFHNYYVSIKMKFSVRENFQQVESMNSHSVMSLTINPNFVMNDTHRDKFKSFAKYFFSEDLFPNYFHEKDEIIEMKISYQIEAGNKQNRDHVQAVIKLTHTKGSNMKLDLDKCNDTWNKFSKKVLGAKDNQKVFINVRLQNDYAKNLKQYVAKK